MQYKTSPLGYSIYSEHDNAIYGENTVHVTVEDESAGPYIKLQDLNDDLKPGVICLEIEQLEAILISARKLIKAHSDA